jgi:hypothetical protein
MLGSQFHPEFKSRPTRPHPLFSTFIATARRRAGLAEMPDVTIATLQPAD